MPTLNVDHGTKSEIEALAQHYNVPVKTIVKALVYMTRDPYNKNMLDHLVKIELAAKEFDRAFSQEKYDEASKAAEKLHKLQTW
ncbi:MAG: hypothetical protein QXI19_02165 [Candidatus Caldarchaeum sp.]